MRKSFILAMLITIASHFNLYSQAENIRDKALRVFFDCNFCDKDHIKKELTFVNYVRDRKDAQVHILLTFETNGAGGTKQTLFFIGQHEFQGQADTLSFSTMSDATEEEFRNKQLLYLKLGLVRYVAKTPLAERLTLSLSDSEDDDDVTDRWNSWVFGVDGNGYFNGEQSYRFVSGRMSLSAQRVTEDLKVEFWSSYYYSERMFKYDDTTVYSTRIDKNFNHLLVKSINQHWSYGYDGSIQSSLFKNIDLGIKLYPALEYNIYPYSKSNRKQLRFLYGVGAKQFYYIDTTVYDKTKELLFGQKLEVTLELIEKWGSISASLEGSHYFHNIKMKKVELYTSLNLRLFKGLSFRVQGGVSLVNDLLNLPKGDISSEDVLLQRKQLASQYEFWGGIGLNYSFGSIFNNVVNPRFGN
jgi:hypothetical protein